MDAMLHIESQMMPLEAQRTFNVNAGPWSDVFPHDILAFMTDLQPLVQRHVSEIVLPRLGANAAVPPLYDQMMQFIGALIDRFERELRAKCLASIATPQQRSQVVIDHLILPIIQSRVPQQYAMFWSLGSHMARVQLIRAYSTFSAAAASTSNASLSSSSASRKRKHDSTDVD